MKIKFRMVFFFLVLITVFVPVRFIAQDTVTANSDLLSQVFDEIFDAGNFDNIATYFSADFTSPATGATGTDPIVMVQSMLRESFPDLGVPAYTIIANDDYAAVWYYLEGTFENEFNGIAPSGMPVGLNHLGIYHVVDGQIAALWTQNDSMSMVGQLGALPMEVDFMPESMWEFTISEQAVAPDTAVALMEQMALDVFNAEDVNALPMMFTNDAVVHLPVSRVPAPLGLDGFAGWLSPVFDAVTNMEIVPAGEDWSESTVVQGDLAVSRYTISFVFENALGDMQPNGNLIEFTGINLYRFEEDKIAEIWFLYDTMDELQQLMAESE